MNAKRRHRSRWRARNQKRQEELVLTRIDAMLQGDRRPLWLRMTSHQIERGLRRYMREVPRLYWRVQLTKLLLPMLISELFALETGGILQGARVKSVALTDGFRQPVRLSCIVQLQRGYPAAVEDYQFSCSAGDLG